LNNATPIPALWMNFRRLIELNLCFVIIRSLGWFVKLFLKSLLLARCNQAPPL